MKIETLEDANAVTCCCPLPVCEENRWWHVKRVFDDYQYLFVPYIKPSGKDSGEIPQLYRTETVKNWQSWERGVAVWYEGWDENPTSAGDYAELRQQVDITTGIDYQGSWTLTQTSNSATVYPGYSDAVLSTNVSAGIGYSISLTHIFSVSEDFAWDEANEDNHQVTDAEKYSVSENTWTHYGDTIRHWTNDSVPSLQGAGGSDNERTYYFDVTTGSLFRRKLTEPLSKTTFFADARAKLESKPFDSKVYTTPPVSSTGIESLKNAIGGAAKKRWPLIEDASPWQAQEVFDGQPPTDFKVTPNLVGLKYKVGIPESWVEKNNAWFAWSIADPDDRGAEPLGRRSVYECSWQEIFFPKKWDEWVDSHNTWETQHAAWEEEDPDERGDEPVEPEKPTAKGDTPTLVNSRVWVYGGPGSSDYSDAFQMPPPNDLGEVRIANMKIICWKSARIGKKPSIHGEVYEFPET